MTEIKEHLPWSETGGVGGHNALGTSKGVEKTPVVFVHGNGGSHLSWTKQIRYFLRNGYSGDEIWAVNISDKERTHEAFRSRIDGFVSNVIDYTGSEGICIVSHSMGVTSSRYWMQTDNNHEIVDFFVGIAGANHGLKICPPSNLVSCVPDSSFIRPCEFLSVYGNDEYHYSTLNNPSETIDGVDYYTIRGEKDNLFRLNPESPKLSGAVRNISVNEDHFGAKDCDASVELCLQWCSKATSKLE